MNPSTVEELGLTFDSVSSSAEVKWRYFDVFKRLLVNKLSGVIDDLSDAKGRQHGGPFIRRMTATQCREPRRSHSHEDDEDAGFTEGY